jgi:hypothetical protein
VFSISSSSSRKYYNLEWAKLHSYSGITISVHSHSTVVAISSQLVICYGLDTIKPTLWRCGAIIDPQIKPLSLKVLMNLGAIALKLIEFLSLHPAK